MCFSLEVVLLGLMVNGTGPFIKHAIGPQTSEVYLMQYKYMYFQL